ncbi:MAG: response regulator [Nitrospirae bacterium]|nr:response regulator [Nitrospirota bacterium]
MSKKILVVEDNEKNKVLVRDILTYYGYEVLEAGNGEEGIRKARESHPDLILMDIQLPVMDGIAAGAILKHDPLTEKIKIIALTSFAMKGDREKILDAGFDAYIPKPIDTRKIPVVIKEMLG